MLVHRTLSIIHALQFLFTCVGSFSSIIIYSSSYNNKNNYGYSFLRQKVFQHHAEESSCDEVENRLMIFGLGNVGALVAKRSMSLVSKSSSLDTGDDPFFDRVYGTARSFKEIPGVQVINFDAYKELQEILPTCTHVLVTIPPVDSPITSNSSSTNATLVGGRPRRWEYFCDPVLNHPNFSLRELLPDNTWVGFISTTSVYGNHDGEWVTEESDTKFKPGSKAELYFRAENEWRSAADECGWRLHVFRAAGLYGDYRSAIHTIRKNGISNAKGDFPTSRIHEEDVSRDKEIGQGI